MKTVYRHLVAQLRDGGGDADQIVLATCAQLQLADFPL
jgi:hypothetical protein